MINMEKWYEYMQKKPDYALSIVLDYIFKPAYQVYSGFIDGRRIADNETEEFLEKVRKDYPIGDKK